MNFYRESFTFFILEDRTVITTDTVECEFDELTGVKLQALYLQIKGLKAFPVVGPRPCSSFTAFSYTFSILIRKIFPYKWVLLEFMSPEIRSVWNGSPVFSVASLKIPSSVNYKYFTFLTKCHSKKTFLRSLNTGNALKRVISWALQLIRHRE
jgi:hypothetical protein